MRRVAGTSVLFLVVLPASGIAFPPGAAVAASETAVGDLWQVRCDVPLADGPQPVTGAILSYYEFKQTMAERLTDEKWRAMLRNGKAPKPLLLGGFVGDK